MKKKMLAVLAATMACAMAGNAKADDYVVPASHLVIDAKHYPHFGVHAVENKPRGFAFAKDPKLNEAFFALAAVAKATGKCLKISYKESRPDENYIGGVTNVEVVDSK
jgi:hypothetical protein